MATITFLSLPTEIQVIIAEQCEQNDLINLCLTSKRVNETCLPVLYRHVNLLFNRYGSGRSILHPDTPVLEVAFMRQQRFVHTLLGHPEYGKHVRSFKARLLAPNFSNYQKLGEYRISEKELWQAMPLLTHVKSVDVASKGSFAACMRVPIGQCPNDLFQSATSVRLVGRMPYSLAKSILNAINPTTLTYLCLDMMKDQNVGQRGFEPGDKGENGRIIAIGVMSGLLTTLTGRCTALRTLILRKIVRRQGHYGWHAAADEAADIEWASFIRSVQGTVKKFTFEQARDHVHIDHDGNSLAYRNTDERFRRLVLPAIVSGNWPCLTIMELRGVSDSNSEGGKAALTEKLRAAFGGDVTIVVEEEARLIHYSRKAFRWN